MPFEVRDQSRVCRFHWGLVGIAYAYCFVYLLYLVTRIIKLGINHKYTAKCACEITLISCYARTRAKKGALHILCAWISLLGCGWPWFWEVCLCWGCSCGGGMSFGMCFLSNYDVRPLMPNYRLVIWDFHLSVKSLLSFGTSKFFVVQMTLSMLNEQSMVYFSAFF